MEVASPAIRHEKLVHLVLNRYFRKNFPPLFKHGFTYEDLVQEGLYAILRAEPHFDPAQFNESTFYAKAIKNWIGSRVCVRHLIYKKRRLNGTAISIDANIPTKFNRDDDDGLPLLGALRSPDVIDESAVMDRIMLDRALDHLRRHSEKQATAVRMRFFDDFDNYQIADALGCSIQNASWLVMNGLKFLRGIYKVQGGQSA